MDASEHTLLVVDDNFENRDVLSRRLQKRGFVVLTAESGQRSLEIIEAQRVDLVLLDVALATPTNGFDLAAGLRRNARTQHLPIIMVTARGFAADVLRGREVGAAGYITKPFTAEEVIRKVRAFLD